MAKSTRIQPAKKAAKKAAVKKVSKAKVKKALPEDAQAWERGESFACAKDESE